MNQHMKLTRCDQAYAGEILAILNEAILNSTAIDDYKPRTLEMIQSWFEAKQRGKYPVIGAIGEHGELLGFASYGSFRSWPAYKYTVEHSVYVAGEHRGQGLGRTLLQEAISSARAQNMHVMIGGIDSQNAVSIRLHERLGFEHAGTIRQAGYKFGRWLDLAFYQLILDTPKKPVEG